MAATTTDATTPSDAAGPTSPFEHVAKIQRTGPSPKNRKNQPQVWVHSEENVSLNYQYSYAEWWGATANFNWRCPEEAFNAVFTLYPTAEGVRAATGVVEVCHHPGGSVRLSVPHQCEKCWMEWKQSMPLPAVDHPAFQRAG